MGKSGKAPIEVSPSTTHPGGVIHFPVADEGAPPSLTGTEAVHLIAALHRTAIEKGYRKVRLDRGQHPDTGDYYELGYVHGEVGVRLSHRPNFGIRRVEGADTQFAVALAENARAAR